MRFYTGQMFPAEYRDRIFMARRGAWNRTKKYGCDIVSVKVSPDGKEVKIEPFLTGFLDEAARTASRFLSIGSCVIRDPRFTEALAAATAPIRGRPPPPPSRCIAGR